MIHHMNWFHEQAGKIADKIEKLLQTADSAKAELVLSELREMLKYREAAVKCAHMVAPYVHPRLTAIAFAAGDERGKFVLRAPPVLQSADDWEETYGAVTTLEEDTATIEGR